MNLTKLALKSLIFGTMLTITTSSVFAASTGVVNANSTVVNEDSSESSGIITNLDLGQTVDILNAEGEFYKISLQGVEKAFVLDKYINILEAEGVIVGDEVAMHVSADENSNTVDTVPYGTKVIVNGTSGQFYRVKYNDENYYIHSNFVIGDMIYKVEKVDGNESVSSNESIYGTIISSTGLNLRAENSTDASVLTVLPKNAIVDILEDSNSEWVYVDYEGQKGYVTSEYVVIQKGVKPQQPEKIVEEEKVVAVNGRTQEIISYAKKFIGVPYVWGGTNLNSGVDCSGFVYSVMKKNGVSLNRTSSSQVNNGYRVTKGELQASDLVFFDTSGPNNGRISHVGIYIGDGKFIHSSSGKTWGVTISSLSEAYYQRTYVTASRVVN